MERKVKGKARLRSCSDFFSIFLASTIWPMLKQTYGRGGKAGILGLVGVFQQHSLLRF